MSICAAEVAIRRKIHEKEQLDGKPKDGNDKDAVIPNDAKKGLLGIPYELIGEIANHLTENRVDVSNLRLVNSHVAMGAMNTFKHVLVQDRVLYPRYDCLAHFAFLCSAFLGLNRMVRNVTVVGEGLKAHEYGSGWAWEHLLQWEDVECTNKDLEVMYDIDASHAAELRTTNQFIHGGGYRRLLGQIMKDCPNLKVVNVRKLEIDEQIPGWAGATMFKELSFFRPGMNTKFIHYGDWQYDTHYHRETVHKDEFGDTYTEPFAGPQASFKEDMLAAVNSTDRKIRINYKT